MSAGAPRSRWVAVGALLALGVALRVSAMFYGTLSGDDATVALMAKHFLSGEDFPAFFYRQTYMGSLNGIHLVPALFLFGPSVLVVRLNAIAWSLLFPLGLYLLTRRIFGEPAARVTLILAALPPFLLTYWSAVAEPHFETNLFGVWLLLLAFRALTVDGEPARTRALAVFGLLAGLAMWTNLKAVTILGPALLLFVLRGLPLLRDRGGALLLGGVLLGSMPAWLFYVVHGDRTEGVSGSVGSIVHVAVDPSLTHLRALWTDVILGLLGTYHWPVDTPWRWASLAVNCAIYGLAVGFALWQLVRERGRRPVGDRAWGLGLLLLTLVASLGAVYVWSRAGDVSRETSRYAVPAYIPLLACAGALVVAAIRKSRALGAALLAFLLVFAMWTNLRFLWPLSPRMRARESAAIAARSVVMERLATRPIEALYVRDTLDALIWAFLLERPPVSAMSSDVYVPHAVAADAAQRIDVLATWHVTEVAEDLGTVGAIFEQTAIQSWRLFEDVRVPARAYRMLPRSGWRVVGDSRVPSSVADGDLVTSWPPLEQEGPRDPLLVDLGHPTAIARLILWPSIPTSELFPLRLSGSKDGIRWETLAVVPASPRRPTFVASGRPVFRPRNGWLEVIVTAALRYLRVEPADPVGSARWGVAELQAYQASGETPARPMDSDRLVERLRAHGIDRFLGNPVASARVSRATGGAVSTLIANGVIDNHGASPPEWLAKPIRLRARDGLLVPIEDVPELRERLDAAGARHVAELLGDHALFRVLAPLVSTAECLSPAKRTVRRERAVDGSESRITLDAALREETLVSGARFWRAAGPVPGLPSVEAAVSQDGRTWQPASGARPVPGWGWAGRTLFAVSDRRVEMVLDPVPARHLRLVVKSHGGEPRLVCVRGTRATGGS